MQKLPIITALNDVEIKKIYGQSILDFHQQVCRLLAKENNDGELSNFFAEPVVNIQRGEISWYTIFTGECIPVATLDDYPRFLISEKLNSIFENINRIQNEVSKGQGSNSLGAEAIQGMLTAPDLMRSLFLVDDKLVLTEWGCTPFGSIPERFDLVIPENRKLQRPFSAFNGENGAAAGDKTETVKEPNLNVHHEPTLGEEPPVLDPMEAVQEDTVNDRTPPTSSLSNPPVSSRRIALPWILFLQLLVIGLLLLLFLFGVYPLRWNAKIKEIGDLKSEIELLWKKAEAKSKSCVVNNSDGTQSEGHVSKGNKQKDKNGLSTPSPIIPVDPLVPVGPDTSSPVIPVKPSEPVSPDSIRPVSPDQPTIQPNRQRLYRSGPRSSDQELLIPRNSQGLAFLQGCWRLSKDLKEVTTGSTLRSRICFSGTEGDGTFEYRFPDGRKCNGFVRSRRNRTEVLINRSKLTCADGAFPPALIRCRTGNNGVLCDIIEIIDGKFVPRSQHTRDTKFIRITKLNLKRRLQTYGTSRGRLEISLAWNTKDDLDLGVICPDLTIINWRNKQACGAKLVLDMNVSDATATGTPVEHIIWGEVPNFTGPLRIAAVLHRKRYPVEDSVPYSITIMLDNNVIKEFRGRLSAKSQRTEKFNFTLPITSETRIP